MSYTVAIAGKGGTGKTTFAGLLVNSLKRVARPILAVDADPSSNLNVVLGFDFYETVADIREETKNLQLPPGLTKTGFLDQKLQEVLVEGEDVDLFVMGRPEGRGCYCAVNNLLRMYLSKISKNYEFVVVDNEAGMEHLSRRTTDDVDILFLVCEISKISLNAASRAKEIAQKLNLRIGRILLIINKVDGLLPEDFKRDLAESNIEIAGEIPFDKQILKLMESGKAILDLKDNSVALDAVNKIVDSIIILRAKSHTLD